MAESISRRGVHFRPGTLLKFEIRLASDQAVITGVGRVVWKRDTVQGTGERPSGMGVKFIKIDDPSKTVIDKLVNSRSDAGRAYESESESPHPDATPAAAAVGALRPPSSVPAANRVGKSTMVGLGATPVASGPARSPSARPGGTLPPRPSVGGGGMFPKASAEDVDTPPKQEQTVMKQAAELLEEALREAGGSMEDVGTNPLFAGSAAAVLAAEKAGLDPKAPSSVPPGDAPSSGPEAARTRAMVAGMSPAPPKRALSDPPRTSRESPLAKGIEPKTASVRPSGRPVMATTPPKARKKKGSGGMLVVLTVAAAAGVAGFVYRDAIFGSEPAPTAPVATAASTMPSPMPPTSGVDNAAPSGAPAVASAQPGASASAAASGASAAPSASSAPSASAAASASVAAPVTTAPVVVRPRPRPIATAAPVATTTAAATAPATAAPTAHDEAPSGGTPAATATATSTATTPPATPPAAPKKPAKPADDNPY